MDPFVSARQMDTDEIVELGALRGWLAALVEMAYQATGYRRIKNPRIWSLARPARAGRGPAMSGGRLHAPHLDALADAPGAGETVIELRAPGPGLFVPAIAAGDLVRPGAVIGRLEVLGRAIELRAPRVGGIVIAPAADGDAAERAVGYGDVLCGLDQTARAGAGDAAGAGRGPGRRGRRPGLHRAAVAGGSTPARPRQAARSSRPATSSTSARRCACSRS